MTESCAVAGCERPCKLRGWCRAHYFRWAKTGDPLTPDRRFRPENERFWAKVNKKSGIRTPEDLKGKRIGSPEWAHSAAVYMRGWLHNDVGVKLTERGNVWRDANWMTSVPGVFTAGDMQRGKSLIVWAIAEGRSAARGVDLFLMGQSDLPAPLA